MACIAGRFFTTKQPEKPDKSQSMWLSIKAEVRRLWGLEFNPLLYKFVLNIYHAPSTELKYRVSVV